jgi:DNA topoisomerase-1
MSKRLKISASSPSSTTLVIVESPAKCSKIESYLGPGYKCIATFGHFRTLDGLKSINMDNFHLKFSCMDEKSKQISRIKSEIESCMGNVIIATDDDREGEAIGWHVCDMFKLPIATTPRIIFHEITKTAIDRAVSTPGTLNMNLVYAQFARQILDLLVGYHISPQLWTHIASSVKNSLSAGRCQTPALRLVFDNQKDIDSSPGKMVYNTVGYFTKLNLPFTLSRHYETPKDVEEFLEESVNHEHVFTLLPSKKISKAPPSPFTTSALQQKASSEYNYSPSETMSICQKLYEGSFITYMRTDSRTYSPEFIENTKRYISEKWSDKYLNPNIQYLALGFSSGGGGGGEDGSSASKQGKTAKASKGSGSDDKGVKAQEAHEAIRPTNISTLKIPDTFTPREQKLYKLIWTNAIESCMSHATGVTITAHLTAPKSNEYKYTTELIEFPGWKAVDGYDKENPNYNYLQNIKKNCTIPYNKIKATVTMNELKSHYTEAGLIKLLEEKGIGRPSTFSSLIEKIQKRGYVEKGDVVGKKFKCTDFELLPDELLEMPTEREFGNEKNKLVIQPLGVIVMDFIIQHFEPLFEYNFTKKMEDDLDKVAKGDILYSETCQFCFDNVKRLTTALKDKNIQKDTVTIDENHVYMVGSKGPVIKHTTLDEAGKKKIEYKSVKKDIDLAKLKRGEYELGDVVDEKGNIDMGGIKLGIYEGEQIILKKGKYGLYFVWGEQKKSLSGLFPKNKNPSTIAYHDIVKIIDSSQKGDMNSGGGGGGGGGIEGIDGSNEYIGNKIAVKGMVRAITDEISIRNGKYGDYIFYKTSLMKNPTFLKIKGFTEDYKTCPVANIIEWINTTYKL